MVNLSEGAKIAQALFSQKDNDNAETVTDGLCLIADAINGIYDNCLEIKQIATAIKADDDISLARAVGNVSESIERVANAIFYFADIFNQNS